MSKNAHSDRVLNSLGGLIAVVFLFAAPSLVAAQVPSQEKIALIRRAVVFITTYDARGKPLLQGSGFFIAPDRIATNMHVIKEAHRIRIDTVDGKTSIVKNVIAVDEKSDLALLHLDAPNNGASILSLEDSAPVEGEAIVVLSNPRGSRWKLTQGQVGRIWEFKDTGNRLQITAAIFPGSSGGPVLNARGRVIGIVVMHLESDDSLNFAVPAESLKTLQASVSVTLNRRSALDP